MNWDANLSFSLFSYSSSTIQEVVIGDNVSIVYPIFSGYTNLQKVTLGKNVTQLRAEAFKGCRIREFYITGDEAPYCYPNVFQNVDLSQAKLYVPIEKKDYYDTTEPWMNFGQIIPVAIRGNALEALSNAYEAYKDYNFKAGTEVGQYGKEEVRAFNAAKFEAMNILSDDSDYTTDEILAALEMLKKTYQAVLDSEVKGIELADGTAYTETTSQTMKKLTYTRTFNNTSWQPLYVPFSMSPADWEAQGLEVARINGFYEYDDDENGTVDRSALEVLKVKSGRLMPNHPYLVRAKNVGEVTIELEDATVYPAEENSGYCCTFETDYTFMGTYSPIGQQELTAKGAYIMGGGKLTPSAGALKPMRWYMVRKSLGGQLLPELAEIKVYVSGEEDEADALDFANAERTVGATYNLTGQKVDGRTAKGIMIRNGKKVLK